MKILPYRKGTIGEMMFKDAEKESYAKGYKKGYREGLAAGKKQAKQRKPTKAKS